MFEDLSHYLYIHIYIYFQLLKLLFKGIYAISYFSVANYFRTYLHRDDITYLFELSNDVLSSDASRSKSSEKGFESSEESCRRRGNNANITLPIFGDLYSAFGTHFGTTRITALGHPQ